MSEPPNTSSAAIARIRAWAAANDWRKSRLAAEAGLPDTTLRSFDSDDWNPTVRTLKKLEALIPPSWGPVEAPSATAPDTEVAAVPDAPFPEAPCPDAGPAKAAA